MNSAAFKLLYINTLLLWISVQIGTNLNQNTKYMANIHTIFPNVTKAHKNTFIVYSADNSKSTPTEYFRTTTNQLNVELFKNFTKRSKEG